MRPKIKERQCYYTGCKTLHKSDTGYCAEHVEAGMRKQWVKPRERAEPLLAEEKPFKLRYDGE